MVLGWLKRNWFLFGNLHSLLGPFAYPAAAHSVLLLAAYAGARQLLVEGFIKSSRLARAPESR